MIRAILLICILAAGAKAFSAVHAFSEKRDAARIAILKGTL